MKYFLLLISVHLISFIHAQEKQIKDISDIYKTVTASIDSAEKDADYMMYGPYYCNQLLVNTGNKPWRAVGIYEKNIKFWYIDEPNHNKEIDVEKNGIGVLRKISTVVHSTYTENSEYLFNEKGQLIFFYYKYNYNNGDPETQEYRFYFSKNILIKYIATVPPTTTDKFYKKEDFNKVLKKAKQYQAMFLNSF